MRPPGHEAPCSHWGEELERERKSQQFKEEIKTKLNLLSPPALKIRWGFVALESPSCPCSRPISLFPPAAANKQQSPTPPLLLWAAQPGWTQPAQPTVTKRTSISPFFMDLLPKRDEILTFCQWLGEGAGHPGLLAGMSPAAPVTGSNSQPCPFDDPLRSEWYFFI